MAGKGRGKGKRKADATDGRKGDDVSTPIKEKVKPGLKNWIRSASTSAMAEAIARHPSKAVTRAHAKKIKEQLLNACRTEMEEEIDKAVESMVDAEDAQQQIGDTPVNRLINYEDYMSDDGEADNNANKPEDILIDSDGEDEFHDSSDELPVGRRTAANMLPIGEAVDDSEETEEINGTIIQHRNVIHPILEEINSSTPPPENNGAAHPALEGLRIINMEADQHLMNLRVNELEEKMANNIKHIEEVMEKKLNTIFERVRTHNWEALRESFERGITSIPALKDFVEEEVLKATALLKNKCEEEKKGLLQSNDLLRKALDTSNGERDQVMIDLAKYKEANNQNFDQLTVVTAEKNGVLKSIKDHIIVMIKENRENRVKDDAYRAAEEERMKTICNKVLKDLLQKQTTSNVIRIIDQQNQRHSSKENNSNVGIGSTHPYTVCSPERNTQSNVQNIPSVNTQAIPLSQTQTNSSINVPIIATQVQNIPVVPQQTVPTVPSQAYTHRKEEKILIDSFGTDLDAEDWIEIFEIRADSANRPMADWPRLMGAHMKDFRSKAYRDFREQHKDLVSDGSSEGWKAYRKEFIERFGSTNKREQAMIELKDLDMKNFKTKKEFFEVVLKTALKTGDENAKAVGPVILANMPKTFRQIFSAMSTDKKSEPIDLFVERLKGLYNVEDNITREVADKEMKEQMLLQKKQQLNNNNNGNNRGPNNRGFNPRFNQNRGQNQNFAANRGQQTPQTGITPATTQSIPTTPTNSGNSPQTTFVRKCFHCGGLDHVRRNCPQFRLLLQGFGGGQTQVFNNSNLNRPSNQANNSVNAIDIDNTEAGNGPPVI